MFITKYVNPINNQCYLTGCCYKEMISCSLVCLSQFSEVLEGYTEKKNLNINKDIGKNSEVYHNKCYNSTPFKKHKTLTDYHKIRQVPKWSYQVVQNLSQVVITVYFSWTFWRNIIPKLSYNWVLHYMYNKLVITMWLCIPITYKYYMYTNKETSTYFYTNIVSWKTPMILYVPQ